MLEHNNRKKKGQALEKIIRSAQYFNVKRELMYVYERI
jgi:hypothetical protein